MTTEDLLEALISSGVKAYKKLNKNTPEGRKLNRHENVTIEELVNKLTDEMLKYAAEMEFEKAAELRDKIKELTK